MNRARDIFPAAVCVSLVLHFYILFSMQIRTVSRETLLSADGRVALINAIIRPETPPAAASMPGASASAIAQISPAPLPEEVQLEIQKTEIKAAEALKIEEPTETVSTVAEATLSAGTAAQTGGVALVGASAETQSAELVPEIGETEEANTASGQAGGDALITHVPQEPAGKEPAVPSPTSGPQKVATADRATPTAASPQSEAGGAGEQPPATEKQAEEPAVEGKPFLPVYRVDRKPELTYKAPLSYPAKAREMDIQGTVILEVYIDEKGAVSDIKVIKSVGFGLDEEAVLWMRASTFSPAYSTDKPVAVKMQYPVTFKLK